MEAIKLSFDMAKQVLTACALVISIILVAARAPDGTMQIDGALWYACLALFGSIVVGFIVLGRHVAVAEDASPDPKDRIIKYTGMLQHGLFLAGMIMLVLHMR